MTPPGHHLFSQPWPEGGYRLFQLGFVVDDLVGSAHEWATTFGVGPFHLLPARDVACTYRGTATGVTMQVGVAQAGPVQIELIAQLCDRPSVFGELARTGPSGFHQVCTLTDDYDGTLAHYRERGYEVACELTGLGARDPRVAYVDTHAALGFFTEVAERTDLFVSQLAAIAATCADWDGTDPVRLLTRDGYEVL